MISDFCLWAREFFLWKFCRRRLNLTDTQEAAGTICRCHGAIVKNAIGRCFGRMLIDFD